MSVISLLATSDSIIICDLRPQLVKPKQPETHGCILSTQDIDGPVLKYQAISIHRTDRISISLAQFYFKKYHTYKEHNCQIWLHIEKKIILLFKN